MGLYLGESKVKITSQQVKYCLQLYSSTPVVNGIILKTYDDYILKDSNGLYLTAKESE